MSKCSILVWGTLPYFSDTPAFTLIVFVLQITYRMKYLVLLLLTIALRIHPLIASLVQHSHWLWSCYKPISLIRSTVSHLLKQFENIKLLDILNNLQDMYSIERTWTISHAWNKNLLLTINRSVCLPYCTCDKSVHWGFVYKNLKFYLLLLNAQYWFDL